MRAPRGSSASAGILGPSRPLGNGSPVERRAQDLPSNRDAILHSKVLLPSGGLGRDTAARKLPFLPRGPCV